MVKANDNYNPAKKNDLVWLFISIAIVFMLPFILPFPISFIVSLIVIFCLGIFRADIALRKAGMGGIKGWYKSLSSSEFGRGWGTGVKDKRVRFSCMNCDNEHNKIACPKCGSKAVRAV
jgi:hypothetical protein